MEKLGMLKLGDGQLQSFLFGQPPRPGHQPLR